MSPTSTLPPEMISDVLSRLPVKSLLRLRCASKPFCSLIDGPDFAKLHLSRSQKSLVLTSFQLYSIESPSLQRAVKIDHPLKNLPGETLVIGSCNGLLCLYNMDTQAVALWNKSTGKHLPVPSTPIAFPKDSSEHDKLWAQVSYGLAHDSLRDDYKLVRIVQFHNTSGTEVRVYSLKSNSWKKISGFRHGLLYWRSGGVLADGALHWPTNRRKGKGALVIVAFDPSTEEFREVLMPPDAPYRESLVMLAALENRLCLINNLVGKKTDVWIMKECWAKLLSMPMPLVAGSISYLIPVAYLSDGNAVLLLMNNETFIRYDFKRNAVKDDVRIEGLPETFDVMPYVDSLVNPLPTVVAGDGATVEKRKGRRGRQGKNNAAKS